VRVALGVDGGGTKTRAVVADERGVVLGAAVSGPSNWEDVGLGGAGAAFRVAVGEALAAANLAPVDVAHAVFGLAGVDWPSDVDRLAFAIDPLALGGGRSTVNDSEIVLRAGTDSAAAVAVVAGGGSVVAGRNADGETFRTLGLGPLFGDFSSAIDVSEEAVRAVARAYTGRGPATALSALLCRRFERPTPADLLEYLSRRELHGRIEHEVENVAPLVIEAARDGDGVARDILDRVGREMGADVVLVAARLGMLREPFDVVLAGGFLTAAGELVTGPLEQVVRLETSEVAFVRLEAAPVVGAVLMALDAAGCAAGADVRARLSAAVGRSADATRARSG
jgi:N-acetylglucosamine kinase-like BadF-type ATPase